MLFLGFSAGIPILLIFSSLSLWLREAGVARSAVTFFSWAALGYSFKFVWAPLIDRLPLPWLTRLLGRRRAWMLTAQCLIILSILWMSSLDPAAGGNSLTLMALAAVMLGFSSATQDIVIDAYRIESADADLQSIMSATYIAGYRIGMLVAGAGALFLADALGTAMGAYSYDAWRWTYMVMSGSMLVGLVTTLLVPEPLSNSKAFNEYPVRDYLALLLLFLVAVVGFIGTYYLSSDQLDLIKRSLGDSAFKHLASFFLEFARLILALTLAWLVMRLSLHFHLLNRSLVVESFVAPVQEFFSRHGAKVAWLLLGLIGVYRISDIVLGVISNVFYQDLGFTKGQIATVVKTFGLFMTIAGGFLGGLLSVHYGVMRILMLGGILAAATNLLFMLLASSGNDIWMLYLVISADNLSAGLASAAFVAFLSGLTNISFTAVQYAIFSSLMTLLPKLLGGFSGTLVDQLGYPNFFLFTTLLGLPVIWLIWFAAKGLDLSFKLRD